MKRRNKPRDKREENQQALAENNAVEKSNEDEINLEVDEAPSRLRVMCLA